MSFSEQIKQSIKQRADFTCCWCRDPEKKVEVHHIVPQAQSGTDTEDNAAPLCSNCHTMYGGNPELRKEVRERRDHWYETCVRRREFAWPPSLHIPLLDSYEEVSEVVTTSSRGTKIIERRQGIQLSDKPFSGNGGVPTVFFTIRYMSEVAQRGPDAAKTLAVSVALPFGLSLTVQVDAHGEWDVSGFIGVLRNQSDIWLLRGRATDDISETPLIYQLRDYLSVLRTSDGENRLSLGTYTPSQGVMAIRARFSERVAGAVAQYLEKVGFAVPSVG
jgi:hypothetical protein